MRLRPVVECYANVLTRADIWALAGTASAELLQNDDGGVAYSFEYYGRASLPSDSTGDELERMPSIHFTTDDLLEFFEDNFGFSTEETVAIMGVHTL